MTIRGRGTCFDSLERHGCLLLPCSQTFPSHFPFPPRATHSPPFFPLPLSPLPLSPPFSQWQHPASTNNPPLDLHPYLRLNNPHPHRTFQTRTKSPGMAIKCIRPFYLSPTLPISPPTSLTSPPFLNLTSRVAPLSLGLTSTYSTTAKSGVITRLLASLSPRPTSPRNLNLPSTLSKVFFSSSSLLAHRPSPLLDVA